MSQRGELVNRLVNRELERGLCKSLYDSLHPINRSLLACMMANIGVYAIEEWERGRAEREKAAFFGNAREDA